MNGVNAPTASLGTHRYNPTGHHRKGTYNSKVQVRSRTASPTPSASKMAHAVMATPSFQAPPGLLDRPGSLTTGCSIAGWPRTTP
jgi:hypothetical protein